VSRILSVRAKLAAVAIVAAVGAALLAGFNLYAARANSEALRGVYESNVQSLVQLQKIGAKLREVRFRVAGVPPRRDARAGLAQPHRRDPQGARRGMVGGARFRSGDERGKSGA
jgi:hypothetical protein